MRSTLGAVLLVAAASACRPAPSGLTLLFLGRSPAAPAGVLFWAADPEHSRIIALDRELRVVRRVTSPRLAVPMAVAALGQDRLLVTELTGEGIVLDTTGRVVREWDSPHPVALYAAAGDRIVAARSPYRVPQFLPEADSAPLIRVLDSLGRPIEGLATIRVPSPPFLTQLVNAGAIATDREGAVYFAPLAQDEIRKYDRNGVLVWTTRRQPGATERDPAYVPAGGGKVGVRQAIANVALVLAPPPPPDGMLYALGSQDSAATLLRVDALDPATGAIRATRLLDSTETAVALDGRGRIVAFAADSLLEGLEPRPSDRPPFEPAFALPDLAGDTVTLARFAGKVTLVNFWASWCDPCREEFPHMAALYRELDRRDFEIAAISDDVDRGKMVAFVREYAPPFPILVGGGRMKGIYHYRGLPYSLLLDRRGRIVERIFGFGGAAEFQRLRETIAKEVSAR